MGAPASRSGCQPTASASISVESSRSGIPSAWPFFGYAPGEYMGKCHVCGVEQYNLDKRASQCLECAVRQAKKVCAERGARIERLEQALSTIASGSKLGTELFERRVVERKGRLTWYAVNILQDNLAACIGTASSALESPHNQSNPKVGE